LSGGLDRQVALLPRTYGVLHALIEAVERAENRNLDVAVVISDETDDIDLRDRRGRKTIRPESFVAIFTFAQPFLHAPCLCDRDGPAFESVLPGARQDSPWLSLTT
jgi:hypothetical protein